MFHRQGQMQRSHVEWKQAQVPLSGGLIVPVLFILYRYYHYYRQRQLSLNICTIMELWIIQLCQCRWMNNSWPWSYVANLVMWIQIIDILTLSSKPWSFASLSSPWSKSQSSTLIAFKEITLLKVGEKRPWCEEQLLDRCRSKVILIIIITTIIIIIIIIIVKIITVTDNFFTGRRCGNVAPFSYQ